MQRSKATIECGLVAKRSPRAIPISLEAPRTRRIGTSVRPLVALDLEDRARIALKRVSKHKMKPNLKDARGPKGSP